MINLKKIGLDSGLEGLKILQEISNDIETSKESPVPEEIDEFLYKGFLILSEEERDKCIRYWVLLDEEIIGYSDIMSF